MGEPFEDNDWRRADTLERQTIREYLTVYHREKSRRALIIPVIFAFPILFLAAVIASMKVNGVRQITAGIITGAVLIAILAVIYAVRILFLGKKLKMITDDAYQVLVTTVTDKERSTRRAGSSGSGFFVELDVVDEFGDRRKLNVSETLYINIQVGSEVMMIRYDEKCFGFYDWFDCVPRKEHL